MRATMRASRRSGAMPIRMSSATLKTLNTTTATTSLRTPHTTLVTSSRRASSNMKPGCASCQYRHECFPAHFPLPPMPVLPVEHKVKNMLQNRRVRRLLPSLFFAASVAGAGAFVYTQRDRLGALSEAYLGHDVFRSVVSRLHEAGVEVREGTTTTTSTSETKVNRERVWDLLATRPEILNSFLFCSCGCGERVDYSTGGFEMKHGRVFNRAHFRCDACGTQLEGTMHQHSHAHGPNSSSAEEDGWVFQKEGKLYCVNDFMDRFCDECATCGSKLGDQLAVDPRMGVAYCVECFHNNDSMAVADRLRVAERVESQSQGESVLREVKQWMRSELGVEFTGAEGDIPLSLLRAEKMDQLKEQSNKLKAGNDPMGGTLGLTVKEAERPSLFSKKVYHPREVILVKGLSKEHAGAVLAHEMMHCWIALYLSRHSELPEDVEEGLCELMSYFWLVHEREHLSAERRTEVEYLLSRMERNWDNAQGRGFHRALSSLQGPQQGNFSDLLAYARDHNDLPLSLAAL